MNFTEKLQAASAGIASQILAANLATGGHDTTLADAVRSLIAGYHEDLPSDIRGVSFTEFTMVSDQTADFAIPHTLGVKPDFAFLWDVDDNGGQRINPANAGGVINAFLDTRSIWYGSTYGRTGSGTWNVWNAMNEYIVGFAAYAYATDKNCMFLYRGTGAKLRSGHTYRMIAISVKRNAGYPPE